MLNLLRISIMIKFVIINFFKFNQYDSIFAFIVIENKNIYLLNIPLTHIYKFCINNFSKNKLRLPLYYT